MTATYCNLQYIFIIAQITKIVNDYVDEMLKVGIKYNRLKSQVERFKKANDHKTSFAFINFSVTPPTMLNVNDL